MQYWHTDRIDENTFEGFGLQYNLIVTPKIQSTITNNVVSALVLLRV